jgi:hypothetical protein
MEAWRVWPRRQKTVSPKYHRGKFFLQAQIDPSFLLTEGTGQTREDTNYYLDYKYIR